MERRDIRTTPRYQFWVSIALYALVGAGVAWLIPQSDWSDLARWVVTLPVVALFYWFFQNKTRLGVRQHVERYQHPILGLYAGIGAFVVTLLLDESPGRALVTGVAVGIAGAGISLLDRWWLTRNDPPGHRRPVPTLTGWRQP